MVWVLSSRFPCGSSTPFSSPSPHPVSTTSPAADPHLSSSPSSPAGDSGSFLEPPSPRVHINAWPLSRVSSTDGDAVLYQHQVLVVHDGVPANGKWVCKATEKEHMLPWTWTDWDVTEEATRAFQYAQEPCLAFRFGARTWLTLPLYVYDTVERQTTMSDLLAFMPCDGSVVAVQIRPSAFAMLDTRWVWACLLDMLPSNSLSSLPSDGEEWDGMVFSPSFQVYTWNTSTRILAVRVPWKAFFKLYQAKAGGVTIQDGKGPYI